MAQAEIITLQLGHFASFVGTHWWNIQEMDFRYNPVDALYEKHREEINHDRLFHTGLTMQDEETYTPRLVLVDLQGSLKHLRQEGVLYDSPSAAGSHLPVWEGQVDTHPSTKAAKNQFLSDLDADDESYLASQELAARGLPSSTALSTSVSTSHTTDVRHDSAAADQKDKPQTNRSHQMYHLDDDVDVWSDLLRLHLHPKSVCLVPGFWHNNAAQPFDTFGAGLEACRNRQFLDDVEERVRFFAEACDYLQGFHVLCDVDDAFGGVSSEALQYLHDDFEQKVIVSVPTIPAMFKDVAPSAVTRRLLNTMFSFQQMAELSSVVLPLSTGTGLFRAEAQSMAFPHLTYKPDLPYHTSAVLASGLDTGTLPYRLRSPLSGIGGFASTLMHGERKIISLRTALPLPFNHHQSLDSLLTSSPCLQQCPWARCLTPLCESSDVALSQVVTVRGLPMTAASSVASSNAVKPLDSLRQHLAAKPSAQFSMSCVVNRPLSVGAPFPNIFPPSIDQRGLLMSAVSGHRPPDVPVLTAPSFATVQSHSSAGRLLQQLISDTSRGQPQLQRAFFELGNLSIEMLTETEESLRQLSESYAH